MAKLAASRKLQDDGDVPARNTAVGRRAQRPPQPDRRLNILLAAEKLFALHGFHAVSIRQIAAEAGVPLALVGYYYGSKNELYEAIFESWQGSIDQRLAALRDVAAVSAARDAIEKIVEAFIGPVLTMHASPQGQYFAVMAARDLAAPAPDADRLERQYFDPMAHAFIDALLVACPGASRGQAAWCYQFAIGAMLHFLLSGERAARLARGEIGVDDPEARSLLMRFIASGFRGSLPQ